MSLLSELNARGGCVMRDCTLRWRVLVTVMFALMLSIQLGAVGSNVPALAGELGARVEGMVSVGTLDAKWLKLSNSLKGVAAVEELADNSDLVEALQDIESDLDDLESAVDDRDAEASVESLIALQSHSKDLADELMEEAQAARDFIVGEMTLLECAYDLGAWLTTYQGTAALGAGASVGFLFGEAAVVFGFQRAIVDGVAGATSQKLEFTNVRTTLEGGGARIPEECGYTRGDLPAVKKMVEGFALEGENRAWDVAAEYRSNGDVSELVHYVCILETDSEQSIHVQIEHLYDCDGTTESANVLDESVRLSSGQSFGWAVDGQGLRYPHSILSTYHPDYRRPSVVVFRITFDGETIERRVGLEDPACEAADEMQNQAVSGTCLPAGSTIRFSGELTDTADIPDGRTIAGNADGTLVVTLPSGECISATVVYEYLMIAGPAPGEGSGQLRTTVDVISLPVLGMVALHLHMEASGTVQYGAFPNAESQYVTGTFQGHFAIGALTVPFSGPGAIHGSTSGSSAVNVRVELDFDMEVALESDLP